MQIELYGEQILCCIGSYEVPAWTPIHSKILLFLWKSFNLLTCFLEEIRSNLIPAKKV